MKTIELIVHRDFTRCVNLPLYLVQILSDRLSYLSPDASEYNTAYTSGKWDGIKRLFDMRRLAFPTGLLYRVVSILKDSKVEYTIIHRHTKPGAVSQVSTYTPKYELYDYQQQAVERALKYSRGVLSIPTGGGKTEIAQEIMHRLGLATTFFVPSISLLTQTKRRFESVFPGKQLVQLGDGKKPVSDPSNDYCLISTVQSGVKQHDSKYLKNSPIVFMDESHHQAANSYIQAVNLTTSGYYYFGLSATPYRHDGKDLELEAWMGPIIFKIDYDDLIHGGYLVPPYFSTVRTLEEGLKLTSGMKTMIFSEKVEDLMAIKDVVEDSNGVVVTGATPSAERDKALQRLANGEISYIACTPIFDEGVDVPAIDAVFFYACSGSRVRAIQRIGRAMRKHPGKDKCLVVDLKDHKYPERLDAYLKEPAFKKRLLN